jgi:uncharacterized protein YdaU (DUF1376 family)
MHYYQHNIGDYRRDTAHLNLLEHGVYRQLLDQYYLNEWPLPSDEIKLMRLICARTEAEIQAVKNVLADFFELESDGWVHKRCEEELLFYQRKSTKASESAKSRWVKDANAMRTQSERNAIGMLTNNLITNNLITNNNNILVEEKNSFEIFWKAYPKKVGRNAAIKSWHKAKPNIDDCLKALSWQKETSQWFKNNGQFIPNPSTWINQHRWEDEPTSEASF